MEPPQKTLGEKIGQALARADFRKWPPVDTITTRFLLLFLFLLAIPLSTVIIFTVSLLAKHLDEAANQQMLLSENLFHVALSDTAEKLSLVDALQRSSGGSATLPACRQQPAAFCRLPAKDSAQSLDASRLKPFRGMIGEQTPFFARTEKGVYMLIPPSDGQPGREFRGTPLDRAFLGRLYRQQPDLKTEIWILADTQPGQPPAIVAQSSQWAYHTPVKALLRELSVSVPKNRILTTVEIQKTPYRILRETLYGPDHQRVGQVVHLLPLIQNRILMSQYYIGIDIIASASLIFSVLLAMLASRTITQPLLRLMNQVNTLSRANVVKFQDEVAVTGVYEINQLGDAFNRMIKRLKQEQKMKDEFVATLTHDLKVPLLAEKQTVSYFLRQAYGPLSEEQVDVLESLRSSNRSCLSLVNGLLEVSRYDSGTVSLVFESFDPVALIQETLAELSSLAQEKSIQLELEAFTDNPENISPASPLMIYADRLEIKRVLHNLISNAIINTPACGRIKCRITDETQYGSHTIYKVSTYPNTTLKYPLKLTDRVLFSIQDSGIGFSNDDLSLLFKQFAASKGRNPMSIGLGLYNCYQVLQAHNGALWVESAEGEGSAVNFLLPRSQQAARDRRIFRDRRRNP